MAQELSDFIDNKVKWLKEFEKYFENVQKVMLNNSKKVEDSVNLAIESKMKTESEVNCFMISITSLKSSCDAIKMTTTNFKQQYMKCIQRNEEYQTRKHSDYTKYVNKWNESSQRFNSLTLVKKLREILEAQEDLRLKIQQSQKDLESLVNTIEIKKEEINKVNKLRIVNFAKFFAHDREELMKIIQEHKVELHNLELIKVNKSKEKQHKIAIENFKTTKTVLEDDISLPYINFNLENTIPQPDLHLSQLSILNEPKADKMPTIINTPAKHKLSKPKLETEDEDVTKSLKHKTDENIDASIIKKPRKEIKILKDVQIDNDLAKSIISKLYIENAKVTDIIAVAENTLIKETEDEVIIPPTQFIDNSQEGNDLLFPPTQFKDCSQTKMTQGTDKVVKDQAMEIDEDTSEIIKKKVSFQLPENLDSVDHIKEPDENMDVDDNNKTTDKEALNAPLEISPSNDYNDKFNDSLLKKIKLLTSPSKIDIVHSDKPVTSKFFDKHNKLNLKPEELMDVTQENTKVSAIKDNTSNEILNKENVKKTDLDDTAKKNNSTKMNDTEIPNVSYKNDHSLNESFNITGFEDGDNLPCIDASLLLSPKGDLTAENEVNDVEKTGFLAGIKKTGVSLFGKTEDKPDSSNSANNFTFDFGGSKKNRGGLFNMFS